VLIASIFSWFLNEIQKVPAGAVYSLIFFLVFGETGLFLGFVLPGETSVLVGGVVASQGRVNVVLLMVLVVVAAITGDSLGYFVGTRYGEKLLTLPFIRNRHVEIRRALDGLEQRGPIYVILARFTTFVRTVMPGLAGMSAMRYRRFLWANVVGGVAWGVGFTLIGYYAGHAITKVEKYATWGGVALVLVVALVVAYQVWHRRRQAAENAEWLRTHPADALGEQTE